MKSTCCLARPDLQNWNACEGLSRGENDKLSFTTQINAKVD